MSESASELTRVRRNVAPQRDWPAPVSRRSLGASTGLHLIVLAVAAAVPIRVLSGAVATPSGGREPVARIELEPSASARPTFARPAPELVPDVALPETDDALEELELVEAELEPEELDPEHGLAFPIADPEWVPSEPWCNPLARLDDVSDALETTAAAESTAPEPERESAAPERATVLDAPRPAYPRLARRMGWEGRVTCRLTIAASGEVTGVSIEESSGHAVLDEAALDALYRWRFRPSTRAGAPSELRHTIAFELTD